MSSLTAIVKVTMGCNLGCDYCYSVLPGSQPVMSREVLERFIEQFLATATESATFVWHGGEPLLAGVEFFEEVVRCQERYRRDGQEVWNGVQTNATPVTPAIAQFLKSAGFKVGVSIDGPQAVHDHFRVFVGGRPSFDRVLRGMQTLRDAGVSFGALCTVTKPALPFCEDIYRFYLSEGLTRMDFLPCFSNSNNPHAVPYAPTADEYADFMIQLFDLWLADDDPEIHIRYFVDALRVLSGQPAHFCKLRSHCLGHITVFPDGTVGPCDELPRHPETMLGNILHDDLGEMLRGEAIKRLDAVWQIGKAQNGHGVMNGLCHHCGEDYLDAETVAADSIFAHIAQAMRASGVEPRSFAPGQPITDHIALVQ